MGLDCIKASINAGFDLSGPFPTLVVVHHLGTTWASQAGCTSEPCVLCLSPHSKMFTDFILNVPAGLLTVPKLHCLIEIVHSDLFTQHGEWIPGNRESGWLFT